MLRIGSIQVDILKRLSVLYPPPVILCGVSGRCDGMCYKYRHVYEEKKYKSIYMYICICTIYIYTYIYICIYIYIYTYIYMYIYIYIYKFSKVRSCKRDLSFQVYFYIYIYYYFFLNLCCQQKKQMTSANSHPSIPISAI